MSGQRVTWMYGATVYARPLPKEALEQITVRMPGYATVTQHTDASTITVSGVIADSPHSDLEVIMQIQAVLHALTTPPFGVYSLHWKDVEVTRVA